MGRRRTTPRSVTVSVTVEPDVYAVRIELTVPAGDDRLKLERRGPSGTTAIVRGYSAAIVSPGVVVARDFEAPLGVPLTYTATTWTAASPTPLDTGSATVTIPDGGCDDSWLTDLVRPNNTQQVALVSLPELAYTIPVAVHDVLGRRTPIVSSDVANTPTFELQFLTEDDASREQARATLGNGVPVLLRTPPANGIGSLYFAVTGFAERRVVNRAREDDRVFAVAGVQVDRPDPLLYDPIPPATYAAVATTFATYADMLAAGSYDAVLYDYSGEEASDVIPWPPQDV
jgi:hypothetical protein